MKRWFTSLAASLVAAAMLLDAPAAGAEPPTLVELFTSQGCSSCPPAEAFVAELAKRDDVIALSMHINYWDYIGWKDPFASEATTGRQRSYARRLSRGMVYTPQTVIDGAAHAVGSDRGSVERAIRKAQAEPRLRLDIGLAQTADKGLVVSLPGADFKGTAAVWLARYDAERTTRVTRGENAGRKLRSTNVVRDLQKIGTWTGQPLELRLPASMLTAGEGGRDGCVIIVQQDDFGPVLGVGRLALSNNPS
ncbi:MAG: DUF1223 domain-containing protein [Proteobacteria bacterium]|nr:DUF1223 domain-containing protein [Pseudomonadota bacterium]